MVVYLARRLLLLPLTLAFILLLNFVIIHLVPGDPATLSSLGGGAGRALSGGEHNRQFRLRYGLTLPILWNSWVFDSTDKVKASLEKALTDPLHADTKTLKDKAPFILRPLYEIMKSGPDSLRPLACELFILGSTKLLPSKTDSIEFQEDEAWNSQIDILRTNFEKNRSVQDVLNACSEPKALTLRQKIHLSFVETRFVHYLSSVIRLDFGTRRNDPYMPVVDVVLHKLCYSLTLSALPYFSTFLLALVFGLIMASRSGKMVDFTLDTAFLILFAIPIFVVAPYFLEKAVQGLHIPFTDIKLPLRGFSSDPQIYENLTSMGRFKDIARHLALPILCLTYNLLAVQTRLAKSAFLEVSSKEYVRFAIAKGVGEKRLWLHHILPNGAIPLVTLAAGSLGVLLGGSVIVETIFEIPGFGKFFYDAILDRDYNVLLFSSIVGSFLTLVGYLIADIVYCLIDPRIDFEKRAT